MTPAELPAYLQSLQARVPAAVGAAANAMATAEHRYLVTNVLIRYSHPPFTKTPSPPGQPPAIVTGTLRRSLRPVYATPAVRATASLAPHTVYARIQELGGHIYPVRRKFLRWFSNVPEGGSFSGYIPIRVGQSAPKGSVLWAHFAKHVYLPPRPYMRPGRDDLVADGTFRREASAAFERTMGVM